MRGHGARVRWRLGVAEDSGGALAVGGAPLTPPRSVDVGSRDGEAVPEVEEERRRETFGEHIG